jgi:hypothetical protein
MEIFPKTLASYSGGSLSIAHPTARKVPHDDYSGRVRKGGQDRVFVLT